MANQQIVKQTFPVLGMSCAACAARVSKTLNRQEGMHSANVNLAAAIATVEYDPSLCSPETMKQAVQNAGFDLLIDTAKEAEKEAKDAHDAHYKQLKFRTTWAIILSLPVAIIGMFSWICHTPTISCGYYRLRWCSGWEADSMSMLGNC